MLKLYLDQVFKQASGFGLVGRLIASNTKDLGSNLAIGNEKNEKNTKKRSGIGQSKGSVNFDRRGYSGPGFYAGLWGYT